MRIACALGLGLALLGGLAKSSQADILSETLMFAETSLAIGPAGGTGEYNFAAPLSLNFAQFNPALGTLNSVKLNYGYDMRLDFVATGGGGSTSVSMGGTFYAGGNAYGGIGGGGGSGGGPGSHSTTFQIVTESMISPESNPPAFNAFLGAGTVPVVFETMGTLTNNPAADVASELFLANTSFVTVTYDFTPVPEPTSIALLCGLTIPAVVVGKRMRTARR